MAKFSFGKFLRGIFTRQKPPEKKAPPRRKTAAKKSAPLDIFADKRDGRTEKSTRRAAAEAGKYARPGEIAKQLGISPQKWTATRKKIEAGELYSPDLRDKLRKIKGELTLDTVHQDYRDVKGEKRKGRLHPSWQTFRKRFPWAKIVKRTSKPDEAFRWWREIGGGAEYFAVVQDRSEKTGKPLYYVVEKRTQPEYKKRGAVDGEIRANQILREAGILWDKISSNK